MAGYEQLEMKRPLFLMQVFFICFSCQADVPGHARQDLGFGPPSAVLHRHGYSSRGQQEIQVRVVELFEEKKKKISAISSSCLAESRLIPLETFAEDEFRLCAHKASSSSSSSSSSRGLFSKLCNLGSVSTNGAWQSFFPSSSFFSFYVTVVLTSPFGARAFWGAPVTSPAGGVKPANVVTARTNKCTALPRPTARAKPFARHSISTPRGASIISDAPSQLE